MPFVAICPSCGSPLSETSVLALAPVCAYCGAVVTETGGTLGLTSAYGVNDPTITRKRVEADLAVFRDYQKKYMGMLEACKQQLNWGVERYAHLPNPPELLQLQPIPPFGEGLWRGLKMGCLWFAGTLLASCCILTVIAISLRDDAYDAYYRTSNHGDPPWFVAAVGLFVLITCGSWVPAVWFNLWPHFKAKAANGNRPLENARRQKVYKEAFTAALRAAEPVKAAQDYRLSCQIRELEGLYTAP